jgi:hypothetical protein
MAGTGHPFPGHGFVLLVLVMVVALLALVLVVAMVTVALGFMAGIGHHFSWPCHSVDLPHCISVTRSRDGRGRGQGCPWHHGRYRPPFSWPCQ